MTLSKSFRKLEWTHLNNAKICLDLTSSYRVDGHVSYGQTAQLYIIPCKSDILSYSGNLCSDFSGSLNTSIVDAIELST